MFPAATGFMQHPKGLVETGCLIVLDKKRKRSDSNCKNEVRCMSYIDSIVSTIEQVRLDRGISIAEIARRIDVDRKRLWYVLNHRREMRVDEFLKICIVLKIDPKKFITREMLAEIKNRMPVESSRRDLL